MREPETRYIVYDVESVPDGALLSRALYPGQGLGPEAALARYCEEHAKDGDPDKVFVPLTFHVPVTVAVARVDAQFGLIDMSSIDEPRFDPRSIVQGFWRGVEFYRDARLVDFNGRGFDLPLLTMTAFRFGISCPRYFDDDRFGFRYRFTEKHIDLMEWMTEFGSYRMVGGLNLLAKILGKPGKREVSGDQVHRLWSEGKLQEISDYCLHDVLDTYFVFLRTRVLMGHVSIDREQEIVESARAFIESRAESVPALREYLDAFGRWDPTPFA